MPRRGKGAVRYIDRHQNMVDQLEKLIDGPALYRPIYSKELARQLGISIRTLQYAMRMTRGETLHGYLRRRRLSAARLKLQQGTMSVKWAALESGVSHLSDFAREYRKLFGELPSSTLRFARAAEGSGPFSLPPRGSSISSQR